MDFVDTGTAGLRQADAMRARAFSWGKVTHRLEEPRNPRADRWTFQPAADRRLSRHSGSQQSGEARPPPQCDRHQPYLIGRASRVSN